jgi:hypothetical protein
MTAPLADVAGQLEDRAEELGFALGEWAYRDSAADRAAARRAANRAMDAIDAMLTQLYALRQALVSEIRDADDATAARADALLAGHREKDDGGAP